MVRRNPANSASRSFRGAIPNPAARRVRVAASSMGMELQANFRRGPTDGCRIGRKLSRSVFFGRSRCGETVRTSAVTTAGRAS